jgi:hypothetical protein
MHIRLIVMDGYDKDGLREPGATFTLPVVPQPGRLEWRSSRLDSTAQSAGVGCPRTRPPMASSPASPASRAPGPRDSGTRRPNALVERAALVLAITRLGLVVGIQKSVLLRLLAEATGARPGDAELGCGGTDGDAAEVSPAIS